MEFSPIHICLVLAILFAAGLASAQVTDNNQIEEECMISVTEKNKKIVQNLYEQALNKRNFETLQEYVSEEFTGPNGKKGGEAFKERIAPLITAFPDVQWNIQELIGEGDKVLIRWKLEGTHTGLFMNIAATGKPVSNDGIGIYKLNEGKIVNARVQTDRLGFLEDLGVLPSDFISSLAASAQEDRVIFIDKFLVPENSKEEFISRMNNNRNFIENLPGFVRDDVYESADEEGNLLIVTIAIWENEYSLNKAKEEVQAEYERIGFNPAEFMERLNIKMERGTYGELLRD